MGDAPDLAHIIAARLTDLTNKDEVKTIPIYNGYATDQFISTWLREVATLNKWDDDTKKRCIASRLKGPALTWHINFIRENPAGTYGAWRQALKTNFCHPADIDKLRHQLNNLKQKPDQQTSHFVNQIRNLYNSVYGERINAGRNPGDPVPEQNAEAKLLRDEMLLRILMQGLLPKIRDAMWTVGLPSDYDWGQATRAAIEAEKLLIARENAEAKPIFSINQNNPTPIELLAMKQMDRIDELEKEIRELSLKNVGSSKPAKPSSIANIEHYSSSNDSRGRTQSRSVTFPKSRSQSREPSYDGRRQDPDRYPKQGYKRERSSIGNRGASNYNQCYSNYNQGYSNYNQGSSNYNQGSSNYNHGYSNHNQNNDHQRSGERSRSRENHKRTNDQG